MKKRQHDSHGSRDRNSAPREKLEWKDEETLSQGSVRAQITSAAKPNGHKIYSVNFYREYNDRRSGHFRPDDMLNVADLAREVKNWIEADQAENRPSFSGRRSYANRSA